MGWQILVTFSHQLRGLRRKLGAQLASQSSTNSVEHSLMRNRTSPPSILSLGMEIMPHIRYSINPATVWPSNLGQILTDFGTHSCVNCWTSSTIWGNSVPSTLCCLTMRTLPSTQVRVKESLCSLSVPYEFVSDFYTKEQHHKPLNTYIRQHWCHFDLTTPKYDNESMPTKHFRDAILIFVSVLHSCQT